MAVGANPAVTAFLARLPAPLVESFSAPQRDAIALHFGMRYQPGHTIHIRKRFGVFYYRYYLVLLAGREHRPTGD